MQINYYKFDQSVDRQKRGVSIFYTSGDALETSRGT